MIVTSDFLRRLSPQDFQALGAQQLAYIKPVEVNGMHVYAIHAADGTQLGLQENLGAAHAVTLQNEMQPVTVH